VVVTSTGLSQPNASAATTTPITVLASVGRAAQQGVIIKEGRALEALVKVDTIAMDKTGSVTFGLPRMTEVISLTDEPEEALPAKAAPCERHSYQVAF
jgi:Cu+-exporting ATPase